MIVGPHYGIVGVWNVQLNQESASVAEIKIIIVVVVVCNFINCKHKVKEVTHTHTHQRARDQSREASLRGELTKQLQDEQEKVKRLREALISLKRVSPTLTSTQCTLSEITNYC